MISPKKLETKRLEICPFTEENFEDFFETINNRDCVKYITRDSEGLIPENAKVLFSSVLSSYNTPISKIILKILKKRTNEYMGLCGVIISNEKVAAECFYALLPLFQGKGYAIEAMIKLLEFSFNILKIPKIKIFLHPDNSKAWKVAERIGMKYMGQLSHRIIIPKAMLFTIEKKEYNSQRKYS